MVEIPDELEGVRRLDLRPGDRCVLHIDRLPSEIQSRQLIDAWERFAPGIPLMVLPLGMTLTVLGKDEECASSA